MYIMVDEREMIFHRMRIDLRGLEQHERMKAEMRFKLKVSEVSFSGDSMVKSKKKYKAKNTHKIQERTATAIKNGITRRFYGALQSSSNNPQ